MKKKRILSLLLCLSLFCTLIVPASTAYAEPPSGSGMQINKTATPNSDGSYTITLEAYATGSQVTSTQTEDVPTDIILVLDQSGSMKDDIGQVQYTAYTGNNTRNKSNYGKRHNGGSANLWHKLDDGSYVSVSVTLQQTLTYNKITKGRNDNSSSGYTNYWNNRNNLYTYVNGEIKKVVYTRERDSFFENWKCKYALEDGTILNQNNKGIMHSPTFQNTDDGYLYLGVLNENQNVYTYTYTDSAGVVQTIGTSTGANTIFIPAFYQRSTTTSGGGSRLAAIQTAVTNFANAVTAKAKGADGEYGTTDDINHRIAVVGFASGLKGNGSYPAYLNTELFIGATQYNYNVNASDHYGSAFQDMNTQDGYDSVMASKNALSAGGATHVDLGIQMANGIFGANAIQTGQKRNRVVIVFTDGIPSSWDTYDSTVANNAISYAQTTKADVPDGYGATVYSVGIFSGADATSAGNQNGNETEKANWFMQRVSSNTQYPQSPSYYLSAADAGTLNSIFQQISNNITTGGSSTTLGSETVVKDIISPYFTLPAGATASGIRIDTYDCTGKTGDTYTWSSASGGSGGASATVNGDQVSVTGFDFSDNWCGTETDTQGATTVRGKKLVISFTVDPKSGFLGGNDVITNSSAGVYENSSAQTPVMTFEQPTVNVPIQDVTVTAGDKNVYLLGDVTAAQLQEGAEVKVGDVTLDLSKADQNYGLESWQTAFVDITATVTKSNDFNATEDGTYTLTATVSPKNSPTTDSAGEAAVEKFGEKTANINVFKPELTFKDSEAYYGADVPDYTDNLTKTEWKHTTAIGDILGTEPELAFTYTPEEGKIDANGKINTKQDIGVDVTVKIKGTDVTDKTTFLHTGCTGQTCALPEGKEFLIHVKTCQLTVSKADGADDESYVFDVLKDGEKYSEVTIEGNTSQTLYELPIGNYTIQENAGWSWRYSANNGGSAALTAQNPNGSITCVNTKNNNQWLNGFSEVVRNIFGTNH